MKILIVNTFDAGGAATACKRLHLGLIAKNIDSKVLLRNKINNWPQSFCYNSERKSTGLIKEGALRLKSIFRQLKSEKKQRNFKFQKEFLKRRAPELEMFSFPNSGIDITESCIYKEADIINLHWVANYLDLKSFFEKNTKPVVWTLHDMNPFTGGEHYKEKYIGINDDGNPGKRKYSEEELKISEEVLKSKKDFFLEIKNLKIVTPSDWLNEEATKSKVFGKSSISTIPNGLDPSLFKNYNQAYSREIVGIPQGKKVLLFVADSLRNNRKGLHFLLEALRKLDSKDLILCAVGDKNSGISLDNVIQLGKIENERMMSKVYSAADVFVIPSLIDNFPNTVLESLMCGTPVIGFPVGGIKEMIHHGENGFLTPDINVLSLTKTINEFLIRKNNFDSKTIRENAIKKYHQDIQVRKYLELYKSMLENK